MREKNRKPIKGCFYEDENNRLTQNNIASWFNQNFSKEADDHQSELELDGDSDNLNLLSEAISDILIRKFCSSTMKIMENKF